jgi:hypothetical protein
LKLGDYVDYQGAPHRCVRYVTQQQTLHITPEGNLFILTEAFYELKNILNGKLAFVLEKQEVTALYEGETKENDKTAFILPRDAIQRMEVD